MKTAIRYYTKFGHSRTMADVIAQDAADLEELRKFVRRQLA